VRLEHPADAGGVAQLGFDQGAAVTETLAVEARADEVGSPQCDDRLAATEEGLDDRAADQALRAGY
jgi:hypothetical protein